MKGGQSEETSDRAATHCSIGIADGIFGDQLSVEATKDGLEFGDGYSTLSWDWILRALSTVRLYDVEALSFCHEPDMPGREHEATS